MMSMRDQIIKEIKIECIKDDYIFLPSVCEWVSEFMCWFYHNCSWLEPVNELDFANQLDFRCYFWEQTTSLPDSIRVYKSI